jgi:glycosyltransferase involved in cell wall biosynthesis
MFERNIIDKSLISIVIPCYNDAIYIEQSVESALNQTYSNIEIVVVDDGSNEETKAVLKKIEHKITKLITQENQGQSTARNVGIREAKGAYVLVLDSDDYFEASFCEKALEQFTQNKEIKIVSSHTNRIFDNNTTDIFKPGGGQIADFLLKNCAMGSAMFKKMDWKKINGYDEMMRNGFEDWEFYIRLIKDEGRAHVIPEPLFNYRLRKNSTTNKANQIKYKLLDYIYTKHRELYITHFDRFIPYLLTKIESEEIEKIKNTKRIDFKIGKAILRPLRWIKAVIK